MSRLDPTPAFARATLHLAAVGPGQMFGRIYLSRYSDPLGYSKAPSRFADPRRRALMSRFGVLYLGSTLKVCFLEAILRDRRNRAIGDYLIGESELRSRRYAWIEPTSRLHLVDLRGDGCVRMGIPSDVPRSANQALARRWSLAFYQHPSQPDGIIYPSRLNEDTNVAIYDRAVTELREVGKSDLIDAPGFAEVLDDLRVAIAS
jgi:RES domain-containing protein